jgi:hypothetical protein
MIIEIPGCSRRRLLSPARINSVADTHCENSGLLPVAEQMSYHVADLVLEAPRLNRLECGPSLGYLLQAL